jgi:hypothetical protein
MVKPGIGWAAGVISGALLVGGITTAAVKVNGSDSNCGSGTASACAAAGNGKAGASAGYDNAAAVSALNSSLGTTHTALNSSTGKASDALGAAVAALNKVQ